jgi:hypothetical protein
VLNGAAAIACTAASRTAAGCLSAADYNTFTNKVGTSSSATAGQVAYFTTTSGTPALISGVSTSSIASGVGITVTNGSTAYVIGAQPSVACNTANGTTFGCLSSTDWNTFNNKQPAGSYLTSYDAFTHPFVGASATTSVLLAASASTTGAIEGGGQGGVEVYSVGSGVGTLGFNSLGYVAGVAGYGALFQLAPSTGQFAAFSESNVSAGASHAHTQVFDWMPDGIFVANQGLISQGSSTITSTLTLSPLGTPAGTFIAADPTGKLIATTTPAGSPAGSSTQVQYNDFGTFGATSNFTFATSTGTLSVKSAQTTGTASVKINFSSTIVPGSVTLQATAASDVTATFPAVSGTVALGTGTANRCAQWASTNTLSAFTVSCVGYPFTAAGNATSTLTQFNGGLTAFASSTIGNGTLGLVINGNATTTGNATSTSFFATTASSTNLFTSNLSIASLTGLLKATAGAVSAASNGTDYTLLSATTCSAGDFVSALTAAGAVTCSTPSSSSAYPFPLTGNATSTLTQFNGGLTAYASSTIGNGALGLTINGAATTTGIAYFPTGLAVGDRMPPINALDVLSVENDSTTAVRGLLVNATYSGPNVAGGAGQGLNANAIGIPTANLTVTTTGGSIRNVYSVANNSVGRNIAQMSGVASLVTLGGTTASTTNAAAFQALVPTVDTGDLLTNYMALWIRGGAVDGTLTNNYGLRIDALTGGTNRWAISQEGTGDLNYFAGNTGIGSTTPWAKLSVVGNTTPVFVVATSTAGASSIPVFEIDANGHPIYSGAKPSCDANCTLVAGNDARFRVKTGSTITSTTVTFAHTWGTLAPICIAEEGDAGTVVAEASSTPTTVTITIASALTAKDLEVICDGIQ